MEPNRPFASGWRRMVARREDEDRPAAAPPPSTAPLPPATWAVPIDRPPEPASARAGTQPRRHSRVLYAYTATTIVVGLAALAWASVTFPIWDTISLTQAGGNEGILLGLLFWILIGLLGGTRVEQLHGYGVLTFHLPFIIAATALGGPVAGGWVAMISTLEGRELREVPWYGTLANHSAMALSAVLGGIVFEVVRQGPLGAITAQPQAAQLVAIVLATFVLSGLSALLATGTVILRDGLTLREAARLLDTSYRKTAASEVVLGWVLVVAYGSVGWWAALICATLVLVIWQAHIDRERARHDAMTGLLSRSGFDARLAEILVGVGRGAGRVAVLAIDLDRFKAVNDQYGHATGDDVIREVGARLRGAVRLTDAAVRLGGDEFGVLLVGVSDRAAAEALSWKIHRSLCEPIETDKATITIGASIGVYVVEPSNRMPTIERIHAVADQEMFLVKAAGGGVRVRVSSDPTQVTQPGLPGTSRPPR
jgi:diguanylate cyclase (GGDEF)-like protein